MLINYFILSFVLFFNVLLYFLIHVLRVPLMFDHKPSCWSPGWRMWSFGVYIYVINTMYFCTEKPIHKVSKPKTDVDLLSILQNAVSKGANLQKEFPKLS